MDCAATVKLDFLCFVEFEIPAFTDHPYPDDVLCRDCDRKFRLSTMPDIMLYLFLFFHSSFQGRLEGAEH